MVKPETLEKVAETINTWAEERSLEPVTDYTKNLTEFYSFDSLDSVELVMDLQDRFDLEISDEDIEKLFPSKPTGELGIGSKPYEGNIQGIAEYIDKRLQNL